MGIQERGLINWRAAAFMQEQGPMLKQAWLDDSKIEKPLLDELQWEGIEQNLLLAMEYASPVVIKIWKNGSFKEYKGILHYMDDINKAL